MDSTWVMEGLLGVIGVMGGLILGSQRKTNSKVEVLKTQFPLMLQRQEDMQKTVSELHQEVKSLSLQITDLGMATAILETEKEKVRDLRQTVKTHQDRLVQIELDVAKTKTHVQNLGKVILKVK